MIVPRNVRRKLVVFSLIAVLFIAMSSVTEGYVVWFNYPESELPHILNVLDPSHTYGGLDEAMAARWNLYADIFMKWSTRRTPVFRNGYNDEVGFLNDSERNSYFSTTGGWAGSMATTVREWTSGYTSDIAYNSGSSWTSSETGTGNLFQGSALRQLGSAIGLRANYYEMSVMNWYHPKTIDAHLMPDDVKYLYDKFPNKAKMVTDMGVWAYSPSGYIDFSPATATPAAVSQGDRIRIDGFYVGNLRNGSQSNAVVRFYLSTNTTITDTFDTLIGTMLFTGDWPAAIGGIYNDINLTVPSTLSPGTYYVGLMVYANGSSQDSITYNNTAYLPTPIVVGAHAPDAPVLGVTTTGTTVTVTWTSVADADGYTLYYAPYPGVSYIGSLGVGTQTTRSFDLWAGAAFYVAVRSYNSAGSSGYSNIEDFTIGAPVTSPSVTTGSATSVTTSSAGLNGTVKPNGASTTYHFEYGTTKSYESTTTSKNAGSGRSNVSVSASITGLIDDTTYYFRLVGVNSAGTSIAQQDRSFVTNSYRVP